MLTFHAVETATRYFALTQAEVTNGTVSDLLKYYHNQQHITDAQFEAKRLEIKFIVRRSDLMRIHIQSFFIPFKDNQTTL